MKHNNEQYLQHYNANNLAYSFLEICKPIKDIVLGKDLFYFRIYKDNYVTMLTTNEQYLNNWLLNFSYFDNTLFQEKLTKAISSVSSVYCAWSYNKLDSLLEFNHSHKLDQGFDIYKRQKDYVEMWAFIGQADIPQFHDFCFTNIIKLENVIDFCSNLLIERNDLFFFKKALISIDISCSLKENFLTYREIECARLIIMGKTAKEIARTLNIAPKTVEVHISHIKLKLEVNSKSQLFEAISNKFNQSSFIL